MTTIQLFNVFAILFSDLITLLNKDLPSYLVSQAIGLTFLEGTVNAAAKNIFLFFLLTFSVMDFVLKIIWVKLK